MSKGHDHDDQALLDELAKLVEQLRLSRYESLMARAQAAPTSGVEEFADLLSRHLLYEEEILFRTLTESAPEGASRKLEGLRSEHGKLREFARELVRSVQRGEIERAGEIGRLFLAGMLDHLHRESGVIREILRQLSPQAAEHVRAQLGLGGTRHPLDEGPQRG